MSPWEQYLNISLPIPKLYAASANPVFSGARDFWMATLPGGLVQEKLTKTSPQSPDPRNLIADVYLIYFPTCAATENQPGVPRNNVLVEAKVNLSNWKAFKGSFNLCVQSLTTSNTNGTTKTDVVRRMDYGPWKLSGSWENHTGESTRGAFEVVYYTDPGTSPPPTGKLPYSMDVESLAALADLMRLTLNGSATLGPNLIKQWSNPEQIILAQDIYGPDSEICTPSPNLGIEGFRRRLENIAVSLTNT
jgi:hypothetical protein